MVTWSGGGQVSHWKWTIIPLHNNAQDTGQWFNATRYGSWKASCPGGTCDQELRVPGLTNGTEYTFRVRGVNGGIAGPAGEAKATPSSGAGALGAGDAAPTGRPAIEGAAAVGAALTAGADGIADADGLTNFRRNGLWGWQWIRVAGAGAETATQTVGGPASGGADALLTRTTLEGLAANDNGGGGDLRARRLEVTFGYGLSAFSDRFTLTPEAGAGFADSGRDWRLGLRLTPAGDAVAIELSFEAVRRENAKPGSGPGAGDGGSGAAEHEVGMRLMSRW